MMKKIAATILIVLLIGTVTTFITFTREEPLTGRDNSLLVMTYNIHYGIEPQSSYNLEKIQDFIEEFSPDIIGFQEISVNSPLNGMINLFGELQNLLEDLGYSHSYISEGGSHYLRNVLFSLHPIKSASTYYYSTQYVYTRSLIEVEVNYLGNQLFVGVTHLAFPQDEKGKSTRLDQIGDILEIFEVRNPNYFVLMGDFNAIPSDPEIQLLQQELRDAYNETNPSSDGFTIPSTSPEKRYDYIFISQLVNAVDCEIPKITLSDHLPVICVLQI